METTWIYTVLVSLFTLIKTAVTIKCLQCTSMLTPKCIGGHLEATPCEKTAKHCLKYVGIHNSGVLTFRDCHETALAPNCSFRQLAGNIAKVCVFTCDTDGCNIGPSACTINSNACGQGHLMAAYSSAMTSQSTYLIYALPLLVFVIIHRVKDVFINKIAMYCFQ